MQNVHDAAGKIDDIYTQPSQPTTAPIAYEFNPGRRFPLYFIRKGLYEAVKENSHYFSGRMMDFGCGSKPYRSLFQVQEYIGVDFASEGHSHENEEIDVYYDGHQIPFASNHFDSILSSEVFEHLFEIGNVLEELHRVLKPGGRMMITCPFVWNEHEVPVDYARYTQFALKHLFEKQGFRIVKYDKKGTFIETLFQMLNLYNEHLIVNGGLFARIPILRGVVWKVLPRLPWVYNTLGETLNRWLPNMDSIYLSNILIVEKVEPRSSS